MTAQIKAQGDKVRDLKKAKAPKEANTWTLTGSWGANEYTKGSGPAWGQFEHPPSRKPTLYSIAGNNGYSSATPDGRSAAELTITSGETRGWTRVSFKGANVKDASVFFDRYLRRSVGLAPPGCAGGRARNRARCTARGTRRRRSVPAGIGGAATEIASPPLRLLLFPPLL